MNNIQRIQEALGRRGLDAILLTDEKNQRYAAGFPFTDGAVLVGRKKAWLLTDSRYIEAAEKTAGGCCAVQMFDRERSLNDLLRAALKECGAEKLAAEDEKLSFARWRAAEKALGLSLLPSGDLMAQLRASKSEEEIACMIRAQRISEPKTRSWRSWCITCSKTAARATPSIPSSSPARRPRCRTAFPATS